MGTSYSHLAWGTWELFAMEMVNVLFQIQHLQNLYIYFIYLQLQWEFNNSRKKYFSLWNTRLIVLFAWESIQAQSKGKKSEPVPGFLHQLWEAADKHGPATMLLCDWVSPNSIKTKYPWGLSLLLQDWRWRLKQSFNPTHLKQAKWSPTLHLYLLRWAYLLLRSPAEHHSSVVCLPG